MTPPRAPPSTNPVTHVPDGWAPVPVGSLDSCQSSVPGYAGVYDLCGNVNEWIDASESDLPDSFCSLRGGSVVGMVDCALNGVGNRQMMQDNIGFRRCSD
jgi:formylglycine-generating enzyme required for sulfatase activity